MRAVSFSVAPAELSIWGSCLVFQELDCGFSNSVTLSFWIFDYCMYINHISVFWVLDYCVYINCIWVLGPWFLCIYKSCLGFGYMYYCASFLNIVCPQIFWGIVKFWLRMWALVWPLTDGVMVCALCSHLPWVVLRAQHVAWNVWLVWWLPWSLICAIIATLAGSSTGLWCPTNTEDIDCPAVVTKSWVGGSAARLNHSWNS